MEKNIALLTTKTCSKCPLVKSMIESKGLDIKYVDVEKNPELAIESTTMSVPSILVYENKEEPFNVLEKYVGQQECIAYINK